MCVNLSILCFLLILCVVDLFFLVKKMANFKVSRVETTPFEGQKPGTSGLRKKVNLKAISN